MKPITLRGVVKNYDWGRQDADSLVYKYSGQQEFKGGRYAELWMGSHPSGPSVAENGKTLPQIIKENNQKDIVYLFKVLSISKPLSIQTHPNKEQAQQLHAKDPKNYPDANDKPELFLTLTPMKAFVGFISQDKLKKLLTLSPFNRLKSIMSLPKQTVDKMIEEIIENKNQFKQRQYVIQKMFKDFGLDVGILVSFLLNYFQLSVGQSFYLKAGLPHAYIEGEILQLMKNSDNVVRLGLTTKFKDTETLLRILDYEQKDLTPLIKKDNYYEGGILRLYEIQQNNTLHLQERSIGLVLQGEFLINGNKYHERSIVFLGAGQITIEGKGKLYFATSQQ